MGWDGYTNTASITISLRGNSDKAYSLTCLLKSPKPKVKLRTKCTLVCDKLEAIQSDIMTEISAGKFLI